jgi:hypothetical protein
MGGELASIEKQVTDLAQTVENGSAYSGTTAWVQNLLARLNADINATGGFTYITEGQGIRTYDVAVTNPLVGAEAHAVVEVKGGTIRIANTKDSSGQWEWKTVFTSGYVNAEVIRAIGQMSASHVEVDANGVHVYDPDGNEVAMFGQDGASIYDPDDGSEVANFGRIDSGGNPTVTIGPGDQPSTFSSDGIGLAGDAFHLSSTKTTEEWGDEQNPTLVEDTKSNIHMESGNDSYTIRSRIDTETSIGEGSGGYGYTNGYMILGVDVEDENGNTLAQPSIELYADPETSQFRATAGDIELNGSGMFSMSGQQFLMVDSHNGVNMWSTAAGTILWSGTYHMTASHTATLAHNVSTCPTGIVLHWQAYVNGSAANQDQCYCFVPKSHVASFAGGGVQMPLMTSGFGNVGCKYVYVYDNRVTGAANNNQSGTASGITYNNAYWVLTQIIAV